MKVTYLSNDEKLVFHHIPKTAGTSVNEYCCKHLGYEATNYNTKYFYDNSFVNLTTEQINQYNFISGHLSFYSHNKINSKNITFTILREPLDRALSQYEHINKSIKNVGVVYKTGNENYEQYQYNKMKMLDFGFREFMNDNIMLNNHIKNYQCKFLDNDISTLYDINRLGDNDHGNEKLCRCKENLNGFSFIGLQENMEKTVLQLCLNCGWKPTKKFDMINVSNAKIDKNNILTDSLNILNKNLKLDYQLYQYAKELFEKQTEGLTYEKVLNNYENNMYLNYRILDINNIKEDAIHFNDGWYSSEVSHRWSGPSNLSEIDFSIQCENNIKVSFLIINEGFNTNNLEISVNYLPVNYIYDKGSKKCSFIITKRVIDLNTKLTTIRLKINKMIKPSCSDANSQDDRKLGICIKDFKLENAI